ncbi:hypothetical protein [Paenibacillus sp. 481]|uniref:hypothetical protein n=1 Tax=Paenibacillus sp. 481 TaxID=2835869 RepID=UPI001E49512B|nr:hypothetical protein [Paenibacillus sp. 481]UHA75324.1 hypothetical protein KIK04_10140 [Paenibacillus sp. 481]
MNNGFKMSHFNHSSNGSDYAVSCDKLSQFEAAEQELRVEYGITVYGSDAEKSAYTLGDLLTNEGFEMYIHARTQKWSGMPALDLHAFGIPFAHKYARFITGIVAVAIKYNVQIDWRPSQIGISHNADAACPFSVHFIDLLPIARDDRDKWIGVYWHRWHINQIHPLLAAVSSYTKTPFSEMWLIVSRAMSEWRVGASASYTASPVMSVGSHTDAQRSTIIQVASLEQNSYNGARTTLS